MQNLLFTIQQPVSCIFVINMIIQLLIGYAKAKIIQSIIQSLFRFYTVIIQIYKICQMDIHINPPREKTQNSQLYEKLLQDQYQISPLNQSKSFQNDPETIEQKVQMIIDLGSNAQTSIMIGKNDDASTLAKQFCFKHNIDPRIITALSNNIKSLQIANFRHKRQESSYKIQRNEQWFDDKQNIDRRNLMVKQQKSHKRNDSSQSRISRTKTGYSNCNDSANISSSNSRVNQTNGTSNKYNVFQRLYQHSRKKYANRQIEVQGNTTQKTRMSLQTNNNINKSLNESSVQICLNIYDKNTKLKQSRMKHNQQLNEIKRQKQLEQCKFKPQINELSSIIAAKLREMDQSGIHQEYDNKHLTKIKQYIIKKEQKEMKQCTFKPKIISKNSKTGTSTSTERCLQLHEDFVTREAKKKMISQQKNKNAKQHQPVINKLSRNLIKKDFFQRLQENKEKKSIRLQNELRSRSKSVEKRPSTGRAPINRNLGQKTIGQYLYEKSKNSRALTTKQPPKVLADPKSSQIYVSSKRLAFQYIFQLLDNDQDGLISSTKINISGFGQQVLRLLAPLLSEMEQVNVQLNVEEFIQAFDRLFQTFSVAQKNQILKFTKGKNKTNLVMQQYSFHPNLNERSLMMARQLCDGEGDIYESSIGRLKQKQERLNRQRAERMLQQYSQCTFHPKVNF